ncbi:aminodeoxychorismate synthase component I [Muricauda sp. JGD-17]|uniref:Aminodeoxychorismate synthase component I n=1 Tax=Flagellimonas ochracea TaxID=2696472 RepID=A0A964TC65_9FLAO|nr:anthranilate synthase component I family protein [Allomuricauda ochracea]NAY90811.1 aminodeoxychorismate synthase component I [Allomuricauda ochracea]
MRKHRVFKIQNISKIKKALLEWSRGYSAVVWLDSNNHKDPYGSFDAALAIGQTDGSSFFVKNIDNLNEYVDKRQDWLFGYFSYDLKNDLEDLVSQNLDGLGFPKIQFFKPSRLIMLKGNELHFQYLKSYADEMEWDYLQIKERLKNLHGSQGNTAKPKIHMRIHKDAYFEKVNKLLEHIHRGNIYEANLCQEFYATDTKIDPWRTYSKLNTISQPPFATFMRMDEHYLMCASPERYLKKIGQTIISQPIKGTAPRGKNLEEDEALKIALAQDEKERAENIMITDLVRNDLSKSALKGSVEVKELCKVYDYKQVHQMISTIVAQVAEDKNTLELIKETFPMGSMTGAPKISAMKIIEALEETKRGLYSGAVGYFAPNGDFDFNVVIRSILYNASKKYVSYSVGSAITAKSDPEREYQECLLKAKAMRSVLEQG